MSAKRFTVHIKWFNYEKTEGEIELFDNGQPLLLSESVEDVQWIKSLLNELNDENEVFKNSDNITELETEIMKLKEETKALKDKCSFMETIIENKGYSVNFDIAKGRWVIE